MSFHDIIPRPVWSRPAARPALAAVCRACRRSAKRVNARRNVRSAVFSVLFVYRAAGRSRRSHLLTWLLIEPETCHHGAQDAGDQTSCRAIPCAAFRVRCRPLYRRRQLGAFPTDRAIAEHDLGNAHERYWPADPPVRDVSSRLVVNDVFRATSGISTEIASCAILQRKPMPLFRHSRGSTGSLIGRSPLS